MQRILLALSPHPLLGMFCCGGDWGRVYLAFTLQMSFGARRTGDQLIERGVVFERPSV